MATIENVNDRTILQQFHSLYERQNETETDVENIDAKIDKETIDRQIADLSINSEIQALKDQIDSLGVLFTYKGEVATIQDLPDTDNKPGDVYYVDSEQSGYIWLEKSGVYQWEQFGPAIDLSEYAKQEDLQQLKSEVDAMNTQVESNASNIVNLTNTKQDKLTAGENITIDENNVISASGGSGGSKLYRHRLCFLNYQFDVLIYYDLFTHTSDPFTLETLYNYLQTRNDTRLDISFIRKDKTVENIIKVFSEIFINSVSVISNGYSIIFNISDNNVVISQERFSTTLGFNSDIVKEVL